MAAALVYAGLAVYLYQPYFKSLNTLQYLFVVNTCSASLGCFVLSRRWTASFWCSLFAGAIYGFGPFALGLLKFHPTASLLAAGIPWLFCPAAFCIRTKCRWLSVLLSALPFLAILLFFQAATYLRLFPISIHARLRATDLPALIAPTVMAERGVTNINLIGFYHIPVAALLMGLAMLLAARRFGVVIILAVGTVLAFCKSFLDVSPVVWLAIPALCCSVIIGAGTQGLVCAGWRDRNPVLAVAAVMAALAIVTLLLATKYFQIFAGLGNKYARLLTDTAIMYILGTVTVAIIFFIARARLRLRWLRLVLLCSAMAVDTFIGATFIVAHML